MRNRKYLLSGIFIILYVALLFTMFSYAKGPFIFNGEIRVGKRQLILGVRVQKQRMLMQ